MVNWKLYIDSPQQQSLDLCGGSLTTGNGYGNSCGYIDGNGWGCGYGSGDGGGRIGGRDQHGYVAYGYCWGNGDGGSVTKW